MHVVIVGCGRVGSTLARGLSAPGSTVAVVDRKSSAFSRLGPDYAGQTVTGIGFDRDVLARAGIERAVALAAVTNGDNSNILIARVAREQFGIERVVARIYDPKRAEIYQRLGIPTVATVAWTAGQIMRRMLPLGAQDEYRDPSGAMALAEVNVGPGWLGRRITLLEQASGARVAFITRYGDPLLPDAETVIQDGDLVHAVYAVADRQRVEGVFESGPRES